MDYKEAVLSKIIDYLKLKKIKYEGRGKTIQFLCPFCKDKSLTAQVVALTSLIKCLSPKCLRKGKKFTLASIVRYYEKDKNEWTKEQIIQYLKDLLKVKAITKQDQEEIDKLFDRYEKEGFSLIPLIKNQKEPIPEKWEQSIHKDRKEWLEWLKLGLNLGFNLTNSGYTVIDIDQNPIPEEVNKLIGNTWIHQSKRGFHPIYKFDKDLPKTSIAEFTFINENNKEIFIKNPNTKIKVNEKITQVRKLEKGDKGILIINGEETEVILKHYLKIDIENSDKGQGAYIVIAPSSVDGAKRKFINDNPIIEIPKEFKDYLLKKIGNTNKETLSEAIKKEIETESYKLPLLEEGEGRHDLLFHYGCILRKNLNPQEVEYSISSLNKIICNPPVPYKEIRNIMDSTTKYDIFDERELANQIMQYLKEVKEAYHRDIERIIAGDNRLSKEEKARIDKAIAYLLKEGLIIKKGRLYTIREDMDWKDTLLDIGIPIDFKMPYFYDVAHFNKGDLLIIGSKNKWGKTHLAINIIKQLVEQGKKPHYIYNESGGRFGRIALQLGLKEGDFFRVKCGNPEKVILKSNTITIYDWVRPPKDEFAKTAEVFDYFTDQLENTQGNLICFVQLKEGGGFFAPNLIGQFPALIGKYLYADESGINTYFEINDVRDPMKKGKNFKIPCIYDWENKLVKRVDELNDKEKNLEIQELEDGKEENDSKKYKN